MAKKKNPNEKVYNYPICLRGDQIKWLNSNTQFKVHQFVREQLDKYIQLKEDIKAITK